MRTLYFFLATLLGGNLVGQQPLELDLVPWADGIGQIVDVANCGDDRLFVVSQWGAIFVVTDSMTVLPDPFLNIYTRVVNGGERGMVSLTFDPDYVNNGYFYVQYMRTGGQYGQSTLSRFQVSDDPNIAIDTSEVILYSFPHPSAIHQGGGMFFGLDSTLYISHGDGGWAGDPADRAQNMNTRMGKILRIKPEADGTYSIPPDNPFYNAGPDTLKEIFAYGLRNPYRMSIDSENGDIWLGDVGQESYDEVDVWPGDSTGAPNFGWRCFEGFMPFNGANCATTGYTVPPVLALAHNILGGNTCAVIGGEVYRGTNFPKMFGRYLFADFCSGEFSTITPDGDGGWENEIGLATGVQGFSSFGTDANGEMYVTNLLENRLYKIIDKCPMVPPVAALISGILSMSDGDEFQWLLGGDTIPGATAQSFEPLVGGYYSCITTFYEDCSFISDSLLFLVTSVAETGSSGIRIYPQPAQDQLIIRAVVPFSVSLAVVLYDNSGRMVGNEVWTAGSLSHAMNVAQYAHGTYVLEMRYSDGSVVDRRTVSVIR